MEKFRCPTCLTLLEGGEQRCAACHSRLRKRGRPIVLGDASRLTARPLFPVERDLQARVVASSAADHPWHRPHVSLAARAPASSQAPEAAPEAVEALLAFEATIVAETRREQDAPRVIDLTIDTVLESGATGPVDIDLTTEPHSEIESELALRRATLSKSLEHTPARGDVQEIFDALHHKARAETDEPAPASAPYPWPFPPESASEPAPPATNVRDRRRWNLVRRSRSDPESS
jgi:hypothetical protein